MGIALQTSYSDTPAVSLPGTLGAGPKFKLPGKNADSVSIPFGTAVAFKPSPTTDQDCILPAASTDQIKGILFRSDSYAPSWTDSSGTFGELDSTGVRAGVMMDLLCEGLIYVATEDGCHPAPAADSRLFVRYGGGTKGALRGTDAGGGTCLDCTKQGEWMSTAAATGLAWLKVNFTAKP